MFFNYHNFNLKGFVCQNDIRPEICGIFVQPDCTVATDSFKLIKVEAVKGFKTDDYPVIPNKPKAMPNFKPFILPVAEADKLVKMFPKKNQNPTLPILDNAIVMSSGKGMAEVGMTNLESYNGVYSRTIEGKFPEYQRLLADDGKYVEACVNIKYLKNIVDFYDKFIDSNVNEVFIRVPVGDKASSKPIKFIGWHGQGEEKQKANAVLMPIKL